MHLYVNTNLPSSRKEFPCFLHKHHTYDTIPCCPVEWGQHENSILYYVHVETKYEKNNMLYTKSWEGMAFPPSFLCKAYTNPSHLYLGGLPNLSHLY